MRHVLLALVLASAAVCRARASHCALLRQSSDEMPERVISVLGTEHELRLVWGGRAPARAAAALFAAVLRHGLRYKNVSLLEKPNDVCQLATQFPQSRNGADCCIVAVSAAWTPAHARNCTAISKCSETYDRRQCTMTGPRFMALGPGVAPLALRLLVYIPPYVARDYECSLYTRWSFYRNKTIIKRCNFITDSEYSTHFSPVESGASSTTDTHKGFAAVLTPSEYMTIAKRLAVRAAAVDLQLTPVTLGNDIEPRHDLVRLLNSNNSFLFLDYDVWASAENVHYVNIPPCTPNETCSLAFDSTGELLVTDSYILGQFAPPVLDAAQRFDPKQMELQKILERETHMTIEEAACSWAAENVDRFQLWLDKSYSKYNMIVLLCEDDPDHERYKEIANITANELNKSIKYAFNVRFIQTNCTNPHEPSKNIQTERNKWQWQQVAGVVAPNTGTSEIGLAANKMQVAVMIYGPSAAPNVNLSPAACSIAGRATDLAAAFRRFLSERRWKRVAILSENDEYAKEFLDALLENDTLVPYRESVSAAAPNELESALQKLHADGARVFVLNTGAATAGVVLCAASRLGMAAPATYAWLARETATVHSCAVQHFAISFVRRGDDKISPDNTNLTKALGVPPWPRLAAPIVDSLALLIKGIDELLRRHPNLVYDIHARGAMRKLSEVLNEMNMSGVTQTLRCRHGALHEPRVFVDLWSGAKRLPLAVWRVASEGVRVELQHLAPHKDATPHDGTRLCYTTRSGGAFAPHCHDAAWAALFIALALAITALLAARRVRLALLERRDNELAARFGAQHERVAAAFTALADHEIDRDALDLREEIGAGHFGRVRLGTLRSQGKPPLEVAVKELREDASPTDLDEFIREAKLLASLRHAHVVRFVGVCDANACPLVLMEHALFGDLLCYVRSRRHLAERVRAGVEAGPEATHVSAEALTRLGREAAEALAYLARLQLVHRDLRAENCLVDAHRTLKLSDFGMTREVGPSTGVYACIRRGVFPVRWMAPESVSRGVFSTASDVWSLGVLLLELATLGARPYGDRPSIAVVEHVSAGGCPTLPHDASSTTCELVLACWRAAAAERPTAAEVAASLALRPRALRPALLSPHTQPDDHAASLFNSAYVTTL